MRYLMNNIVWGAASLPPAVQLSLPHQKFIDADSAEDAFKTLEVEHGRGALLMSAEASATGRRHIASIDDVIAEAKRAPFMLVKEETHSYVSREYRERTEDDVVFTYLTREEDGTMVYTADHEPWSRVEIHLPENYFGADSETPHFIAVPNFVVEPVRPEAVKDDRDWQPGDDRDNLPRPDPFKVSEDSPRYITGGETFEQTRNTARQPYTVGLLRRLMANLSDDAPLYFAILDDNQRDGQKEAHVNTVEAQADLGFTIWLDEAGKLDGARVDRVSEGRPMYRAPKDCVSSVTIIVDGGQLASAMRKWLASNASDSECACLLVAGYLKFIPGGRGALGATAKGWSEAQNPKRVSEEIRDYVRTSLADERQRDTYVTWHRTEGGGGGSGKRKNTKTPVRAVLLDETERSVRIALDRGATWVRRANVTFDTEN